MLKLSWAVKRASGRPLAAADIERYEITALHDGEILLVDAPKPGDTSISYPFTDPGVYSFTLICVPKVGGASDPVSGSSTVVDSTQVIVMDFTVEVVGLE